MAIDTAEKRRAVAAFGAPIGGVGVTPNAARDAEWRQSVAWGYPGVPATTVTLEVYTLPVTIDGTTVLSVSLEGARSLAVTVDGARTITVEVDSP